MCILQSAEEVTTFCRQHDFLREIEKQTELSDAEKLRRIILELVDTEKNYLKVCRITYISMNEFMHNTLNIVYNNDRPNPNFVIQDVQTLLKRYLEPLRRENFLPAEEVNFLQFPINNFSSWLRITWVGTKGIFCFQVNSLTENVSQIIEFQSSFCNEIQQLIDCEEDFKNINEVELFQVCFILNFREVMAAFGVIYGQSYLSFVPTSY